MKIEYKGKTLETEHYIEITDAEYEELKKEYFKKPSFTEVKMNFLNIKNGGTKNTEIVEYYVKDLMIKTKLYQCKWSIEDVFNSKELLSHFWQKTKLNSEVFLDTEGTKRKLETCFRLGGAGVAKIPTNFPIKTVDEILEKYNINGNWYDFSCGWGNRLLGALKNNVNYYGTDPNYLLTDRLIQMSNDYKKTVYNHNVVDIRTHGSEVFVEEWKNKMGLAFSSPPYFYLEDYKIGNQSWHEGVSYQEWQDNYLEPTIQNIYQYLTKDGYFLINIKNFKKYNLVNDTKELSIKNGFKYIGFHSLENLKRINNKGNLIDNDEKIMVFVKQENETNELRKPPQTNIFDFIGE